MSSQQETAVWFCLIEGEQLGPLTVEQLRALTKQGRLQRENLVWKLGHDRKVRASEIQGLFDVPEQVANSSGRTMPHAPDVKFDAFISYSSDDKATADAICAELESKKVRCWIAPRDVLPSVSYAEAIIDGINSSRSMIVIFSASSNGSQQVLREVERGVNKGIPIIPFRIEDIKPSKSMEYFLSAPHWLDALTKPMEAHIKRLSNVVLAVLESQEPILSSIRIADDEHGNEPIPQKSSASGLFSHITNKLQFVVASWLGLPAKVRLASILFPLILLAFAGLVSTLSPNPSTRALAEYERQLMTGRGSVAFLRQAAPTNFPVWQRLAAAGDPVGELFIARCYQEGIVVDRDVKIAVDYLERSVAKGNDYATVNLGACYGLGQGVEVDKTKEMQLYLEAYKKKNSLAAFNIGILYKQGYGNKADPELAFEWFRKSAELGFTSAMKAVGDCYRDGVGVAKDENESEQWYQRAEKAGNAFLIGKSFGRQFAKQFRGVPSERKHAGEQESCNLSHQYFVGQISTIGLSQHLRLIFYIRFHCRKDRFGRSAYG